MIVYLRLQLNELHWNENKPRWKVSVWSALIDKQAVKRAEDIDGDARTTVSDYMHFNIRVYIGWLAI